jgi:hypothetical protein
MAQKKMDQDGIMMKTAVEDDVEGHGSSKVKSAPDGVAPKKRSVVDDSDVEGHGSSKVKSAPDGVAPKKRSAIDEDDVEGHKGHVKSAPDGVAGGPKRSAIDEDDVEGHNFGLMSPILARDLAQSKNRDIERSASRNNLVSEAKRARTRKP